MSMVFLLHVGPLFYEWPLVQLFHAAQRDL